MSYFWSTFLLLALVLQVVFAPPVDPKKKEEGGKEGEEGGDEFGLEYGRYLQEVVKLLEEDKDFAKKLENVSADKIKSGEVANELQFVKHSVRTKLDELKRIELERLRKLARESMERQELGLDRRAGVKIPHHLDYRNPHTFEINDLKKLIVTATKDLEKLDQQRREDFKKYEMEKELQYQESLKNLTEEQKQDIVKKHDELKEKHKEHPKIHHPGSKPQLEQVWEEQDHMAKEDFDPKTFFAMHDLNGDGQLDEQEISAVLNLEVKKVYDPRNIEDDPVEMMEEVNRMREHVMKEGDKNKDGLISKQEFLDMTRREDFEKDEGWKGLDEEQIYSQDEYRQYERQRLEEMHRMQQAYGQMPPQYYPGQVPIHPQAYGAHPQQQYGMHPQADPRQFAGHPGQGVPPQYHGQGIPPQGAPYQGVPQHHGGVGQQHPGGAYQQGVPQHHGGAGQQYPGGVPQHLGGAGQQYPGGVPQHQGGAGQQYPGGVPQHQGGAGQQYPGGVPQHGGPGQGVPPPHIQQGVHPQAGGAAHVQAQQQHEPVPAGGNVPQQPDVEARQGQPQPHPADPAQGLGGQPKVQPVDGNAVHGDQPPKSQP